MIRYITVENNGLSPLIPRNDNLRSKLLPFGQDKCIKINCLTKQINYKWIAKNLFFLTPLIRWLDKRDIFLCSQLV